MIQYIEEKRMQPDAQAENLPKAKRRVLDFMATMLMGIQGRLQRTAMEV